MGHELFNRKRIIVLQHLSQRNAGMKFKPCNGECTDEGLYCEGCGRTHQEVDAMRQPVEKLVALYKKMNYENLDDFADAVASSIKYRMEAGH